MGRGWSGYDWREVMGFLVVSGRVYKEFYIRIDFEIRKILFIWEVSNLLV